MSEVVRAETNFLETRLERAYQRVSDHWIPANNKLLAKIINGLSDGIYDLDVEFLINELKTDLGLFTSCLKEIIAMNKQVGDGPLKGLSPLDFLRQAGVDGIKKAIERITQRSSSHSLESASKLQSLRLKEAMISSSTAETLAESRPIGGEVGFSAALIRQLGFLLISWNYPNVYQRAVEKAESELALEDVLNEALGFSPQMLASYVITKWELDPSLTKLLNVNKSKDQTLSIAEGLEDSNFLMHICEVGEALARADNPEIYHSASKDWIEARQAIETTLGPQGLRLVQEQVRKNCENYIAAMPAVFSDTKNLNPQVKITSYQENTLLHSNPFVKSCTPYLKRAFKELYASMDHQAISQHSVRTISHEIIPSAGFAAGCIYIYDPSKKAFIPRLKIGNPTLRTFSLIQLNMHTRSNDPIAIAFECTAPMVEHSKKGHAADIASITAALGDLKKIGVIYLELPQISLNDPEQNMLTHFKAIRRALEDALKI